MTSPATNTIAAGSTAKAVPEEKRKGVQGTSAIDRPSIGLTHCCFHWRKPRANLTYGWKDAEKQVSESIVPLWTENTRCNDIVLADFSFFFFTFTKEKLKKKKRTSNVLLTPRNHWVTGFRPTGEIISILCANLLNISLSVISMSSHCVCGIIHLHFSTRGRRCRLPPSPKRSPAESDSCLEFVQFKEGMGETTTLHQRLAIKTDSDRRPSGSTTDLVHPSPANSLFSDFHLTDDNTFHSKELQVFIHGLFLFVHTLWMQLCCTGNGWGTEAKMERRKNNNFVLFLWGNGPSCWKTDLFHLLPLT